MSEFVNPAILTEPSLPPLGDSVVPSWTPPSFGDSLEKLGAAFETARQASIYDSNASSADAALMAATQKRIVDIKQATGQTLPNPLLDGYLPEAMRDWAAGDPAHRGVLDTSTSTSVDDLNLPADDALEIRRLQMQRFQGALGELAARYPAASAAKLDEPLDVSAKELANKAVSDAQAAYGQAGSGWGAWIASLAGGAAGGLRDPIQLGALAFGGGEATAFKSIAGQMLETFVRQGAVNAGVQALSEPEVAKWRAERGQAMSGGDMLQDIGQAFLFGGGAGALLHGAGATLGRVRELVGRAGDGDAGAAAQLAARLPEGQAPELRQALGSVVDDAHAAQGAPPIGLDPEVARAQLRDAGRAMERPDAALPETYSSDLPGTHTAPGAEGAEPDLSSSIPAADFDARISRRAAAIDPETFARADDLDNRIAAVRSQMAELQARPAAEPVIGQQRLAEAQAELAQITGKRRSSPRAKALRAEIDELTSLGERFANSDDQRAGERTQGLRLYLNDLQNDRARLGPAVNAARTQAEQEAAAMGFTRETEPGRAAAAALGAPAEEQAAAGREAMRGGATPREGASAIARAKAVPEATARLLGVEDAPLSRTLDRPQPIEAPAAPKAEPAEEGAAAKPEAEAGAKAKPAAADPNDRLDDLFPEGRPPEGDPLAKVPVVRDGKLALVDHADIGGGIERTDYLAGLIENCIL